MAIQKVEDQLADVRFYNPLDSYYYTVDNRPLTDLDSNIRLLAAATDASAGSAERAALGVATAAYSQLGYGKVVGGDPIRQGRGMFSSNYDLFGSELRINHGYMVYPVDRGGSPAYIEPVVAVHDAVTSIIPQAGRGGTVQVTYRDATTDDRVPSGASPVQVAVVTFKQGTGPGIFPIPDANNIAIMHIDVPSGSTQLEESYITKINMKTIAETSDLVGRSKITYTSYVTNMAQGSTTINLSGTAIDSDRIDSVEVFVEGVNQFEWTYNTGSNQIVLPSPLTESAEVRVRQSNLELI